MSLFVAELMNRPLAIFNAGNQSEAEEFVDEGEFIGDLTLQTRNGRAVWDGVQPIQVREAEPAEAQVWQMVWAEADRSGEADEGDLICVWLTDPPKTEGLRLH